MDRSPIRKRKQGVSEGGYQGLAKFAMRRAAHKAHIAKEQEPILATRIKELELNLCNVSRNYLRYIDELHSRLLRQEEMMESQKEVNAYLMTWLSNLTSIHQTYCRMFTSLSSAKPPFQSANKLFRFYGHQKPIDPFGDFPLSCVNNREKQVFCPPSPFPPNALHDMPSNSEHTTDNDFVEGLWYNTDN